MKIILRISFITFAFCIVTGICATQYSNASGRSKFAKQFDVSAGGNNFANEKYFNRRITMYQEYCLPMEEHFIIHWEHKILIR